MTVGGKFILVRVVIGRVIQRVQRLARDGAVRGVSFVGVGGVFGDDARSQRTVGFTVIVGIVSMRRRVVSALVVHASGIRHGVMRVIACIAVSVRRRVVSALVVHASGVGH